LKYLFIIIIFISQFSLSCCYFLGDKNIDEIIKNYLSDQECTIATLSVYSNRNMKTVNINLRWSYGLISC